MPYRPTSLDFINRPNPVEPHAVLDKHPLDNTPRLEQTSNQDLRRLLLDKNVSPRPAKRRKSVETSKSLDLPKLPAVKNGGTKRLRIPPTLSGLHQPPPDAGLLPSMSVEQPMNLSAKVVQPEPPTSVQPRARKLVHESNLTLERNSPTNQKPAISKRKRNKWTDEETASLLKGVARFGIGTWTQILHCPDYQFHGRTAIDLKDRFRICRPDDYSTTRRKVKKSRASEDNELLAAQKGSSNDTSETNISPCNKRTHEVSTSQLHELGIDSSSFEKSKRRRRTAYSTTEDDALLRGFQKHGNSWAVIRQDEDVLKNRTATDLRDRLRTRFPDEYAKAGLALRADAKTAKAGKGDEESTSSAGKLFEQAVESTVNPTAEPSQKRTGKENNEPQSTVQHKQPPTSLLHIDDVFWGAPFDVEDTEIERVTLDRRILDWPYDIPKPSAPITSDLGTRSNGIDPLATLNLPRPTASAVHNSNAFGSSLPQNSNAPSALLPSLAAITAVSGLDDFGTDQLELPSLMNTFGGLEHDGRTGGHFMMSLDELLT